MNKKIKVVGISLVSTMLMACGSNVAQLNLAQTIQTTTATVVSVEEMQEITASEIEVLYDISTSDYVQFSGKMSAIGTSADEIIIIEAKDSDTAKEIYEKAQQRLSDKLRQAEGYLPEAYAVIEKGVVRIDGNFVSLFVTENVETVVSTYEEELAK